MRKSTSPTFTTSNNSLPRARVLQLLNDVARRAYEVGYKDAAIGLQQQPDKVVVTEKHLWKIV